MAMYVGPLLLYTVYATMTEVDPPPPHEERRRRGWTTRDGCRAGTVILLFRGIYLREIIPREKYIFYDMRETFPEEGKSSSEDCFSFFISICVMM
jgi:hypothetical protein